MPKSEQKCTVCKRPVLWSEAHGWLHYDAKKKRVIYRSQDKSGHAPTSKWEW